MTVEALRTSTKGCVEAQEDFLLSALDVNFIFLHFFSRKTYFLFNTRSILSGPSLTARIFFNSDFVVIIEKILKDICFYPIQLMFSEIVK